MTTPTHKINPSLIVPPNEIAGRIAALQARMESRSIQSVLIVQKMDLLYFSGCTQNALVYIPHRGEPLLMVRKYAPRAAKESPIANQVGIQSIREIPERIMDFYGKLPRVLGLVWDVLPFREFRFYQSLLSSRAYVDVSDVLHKIRSIKSPWEIDRVRDSARICSRTLHYLESGIQPAMSETAIAGKAEAFSRPHGHGGGIRVRRHGQDDRSFIAFSENRAVSPEAPTSIAFRSVCNGYHCEKARPFFPGKATGTIRDEMKILEEKHRQMIARVAPGTALERLVQDIESRGDDIAGTKKRFNLKWSLHGTGLELYEPPFYPSVGISPAGTLVPGMCVVLETRMDHEEGPCLLMKDTFVMEDSGLRHLGTAHVDQEPGNSLRAGEKTSTSSARSRHWPVCGTLLGT